MTMQISEFNTNTVYKYVFNFGTLLAVVKNTTYFKF